MPRYPWQFHLLLSKIRDRRMFVDTANVLPNASRENNDNIMHSIRHAANMSCPSIEFVEVNLDERKVSRTSRQHTNMLRSIY